MEGSGITGEELNALVARSAEANAAFMRGDMRRYLALVTHSEDYTLMPPFGGPPVRGFDTSEERLAELARFFTAGTATFEVVQSYASGDLVVLAALERQRAEVGGLPEQEWSLRVTLVWRRDAGGWRLVHRHADPLLRNIGLDRAAAIARGA